MNNDLMFSSATVEHGTPQDFFDKLNAVHHFTLDPCATAANAKCKKFYTREQDGLAQSWANEIVFMNPPYGEPENPCALGAVQVVRAGYAPALMPIYNAKGHKTGETLAICPKKRCIKRGYHVSEYIPGVIDWVRKAAESSRLEGATVVCLIPARTDTGWMQTFVLTHGKVDPKKADVTFIKGRLRFGAATASAPFPNLVAIFKAKKRGLK
jgi:phage N-6-adenine-methyltransferase